MGDFLLPVLRKAERERGHDSLQRCSGDHVSDHLSHFSNHGVCARHFGGTHPEKGHGAGWHAPSPGRAWGSCLLAFPGVPWTRGAHVRLSPGTVGGAWIYFPGVQTHVPQFDSGKLNPGCRGGGTLRRGEVEEGVLELSLALAY